MTMAMAQTQRIVADAAPLSLHWWRAEPNLGDALAPLVVAWVAGREVVWSGVEKARLFAVGSILNRVRKGSEGRADADRPVVWGTGCLEPPVRDFIARVRFAAVRGPVTASILGLDVDRFGDPGILMAETLGEDVPRADRIGLIPHFRDLDDPRIRDLLAREPALTLIDVRGDPRAVSRQIAACRHVISSSLHGLVVADSFGIPNTLLASSNPLARRQLKFHDYAGSVARPMNRPLPIDEVQAFILGLRDAPLAHAEGVARSKADLLAAFPSDLKGVPA